MDGCLQLHSGVVHLMFYTGTLPYLVAQPFLFRMGVIQEFAFHHPPCAPENPGGEVQISTVNGH